MSHLFNDPKKFKKLLENFKIDPTRRIYKEVPTFQLLKASTILKLCQFKFLVNYSEKLMNTMQKILGNKLYFMIVKDTLGHQFTAGENVNECKKMIEYLDKMNVQVAVNYMMEYIPGID